MSSAKMEKMEYRSVIKYLHLEGKSEKDIYERLLNTYGDTSPSYATVKRWKNEFTWGREDLKDAPREGRPVTATTEENVKRVHDAILENRKIDIIHLVDELNLSSGTISSIIHDHLLMKKLCAHWVPRMLTDAMKEKRVTMSRDLLDIYNRDPEDFHFRIVTGDETWIHHYDPESKQQSSEWKHPGSPRTNKFKLISPPRR